jgi:O-antigen biosynthesis protein
VAVVAAHARGLLRDHGVEAELVVTDARQGFSAAATGVRVRTLEEAVGRRYDVAVATWWRTAQALWKLDAGRRAMLLQSFEQRFYDRDAPFDRLAAEATLALPLNFVTASEWMRALLKELRPDARCWVVPPGVDKPVFASEDHVRRDGPLRVLIEGQPTLPFKGVQEGVAAVRAMREPVHSTLVALDRDVVGEVAVDRVVGGLDSAGMAALYRESHVLLKLSRVEGLGLAPVEGFHSGLPCVLTPYTGHAEYARHGENALVVGFDDPNGTTAALDMLARDRALLAALSAGTRETAASWPSQEQSTRALLDVLTEIVDSDPAATDDALLLRTLALNTELGRARLGRREAATEHALTAAEGLVRELSASRDECGQMLEDTRAELARIQSSRPYRIGRAASRAAKRLGRR